VIGTELQDNSAKPIHLLLNWRPPKQECHGKWRDFARLVTAMNPALQRFLQTLREHEAELRALGVRHASLFGSVARGDARDDSDVDVLVDLDPERPMGLFEYSRLKLHIAELLGSSTDVVNRKTLKPLMRDNVLHEAIDAF
jgi:predicted nucleotidyltransferase